MAQADKAFDSLDKPKMKFNYKTKEWVEKPKITPIITTLIDSKELTKAQVERLAILAEECGEVQQMVGKILRHGYNNRKTINHPTNRKRLESELGDLLNIISAMWYSDDINVDNTLENMLNKGSTWLSHTYHQGK